MEITAMQMYWLLKLDDISAMLEFVSKASVFFLLLVTLFGGLLFEAWDMPEPYEKIKRFFKIFAPVVIILFVVTALVPTTKQMATIIVVPKIINNEQVQQLPEKILNLGIEWLDELGVKKNENKN